MVQLGDGFAEFSFCRPMADFVYLTGDFNNSRTGQLPMVRDAEGHWPAALRLPNRDYKFRYSVDGEWFCDFAALGLESGPFGPDSIVRAIGSICEPRTGINTGIRSVRTTRAGHNHCCGKGQAQA